MAYTAETKKLINELEEEVKKVEEAIQFAFSGSAENGSFLRGTRNEWVPCAFVTANKLKRLAAELKKEFEPPKA